MTREFLKSLGIEDKEVADKIMAENGKDINAEKAKYGDYESLKTQITEANKQIEDFKSMDIDGIKKAADDYKTKYEQAQEESKKQLDELRFSHALDSALTGAKAKNAKAVKALLETDKLKLNKDGTLTGLTEQLEKVRSENDYLFEAEKAPDGAPRFLGGSGGSSAASGDDAAIRAIMGLPASK